MTSLIRVKYFFLFLIFTLNVVDAQDGLVAFDEHSITLSRIIFDKSLHVTSYNVNSKGNGISINLLDENHLIIEGLLPGEVYGITDLNGEEHYFATRSRSSGEMKVYFNNDVDTSFSDGSQPVSTSIGILERDLIKLIDNAETSIDFCAYNTSRTSIVGALIDAYARGVQVRVITDDETRNSGWEGNIPFPVVRGNKGDDLMHNKFFVIDADKQENSWVLTGAMNFTTNQMETDPNHMIWIQDKSLAQTYTIEFEEMWGSNGAEPNPSTARFGNDKNDNTPHIFDIGGRRVESYFSPSDNTAFHIGEAVKSTDEEINVGLLIFTYFDLKDELVKLHQSDTKVRVIVENIGSSSSVISDLRAVGIPVSNHPPSQLFHHKYAIIDEGSNSDPIVVTGSHNWTFSADNYNDENTLIIHDQSIANIFKQEFQRWWGELSTSTADVSSAEVKISPNPSNSRILVECNEIIDQMSIVSLDGRILYSDRLKVSAWEVDVKNYNNGLYLLLINGKVAGRFIKQ
ncbi:MAG: hypothetical protein HKN68_05395 [Saprospiraceae bacterium]|nr:hypothetical protein [Saprospiraceae bacterium]